MMIYISVGIEGLTSRTRWQLIVLIHKRKQLFHFSSTKNQIGQNVIGIKINRRSKTGSVPQNSRAGWEMKQSVVVIVNRINDWLVFISML